MMMESVIFASGPVVGFVAGMVVAWAITERGA